MATIIKPSAAIRQNYNEISELCRKTQTPVFLTKNGEGDLVVMDIDTYDKRERQLELREKLIELIEIEEMRRTGAEDYSARSVSEEFRESLLKN